MADRLPVRRGSAVPAQREDTGQQYRPDPFYLPFAEFDDFFDRMVSRFFGSQAWPEWSRDGTRDWAPAADIEETDDAWIFEVELPGVRRDDIRVELGDSELIVTGKVEERVHSGVLRRRTRRTGSFEYRATVPPGVDAEHVDATFDNGLLTVKVPRPEQTRPRRIKIN